MWNRLSCEPFACGLGFATIAADRIADCSVLGAGGCSLKRRQICELGWARPWAVSDLMSCLSAAWSRWRGPARFLSRSWRNKWRGPARFLRRLKLTVWAGVVRRELPPDCLESVYWQMHAQDSVLRRARWDLWPCIKAANLQRKSKWPSESPPTPSCFGSDLLLGASCLDVRILTFCQLMGFPLNHKKLNF